MTSDVPSRLRGVEAELDRRFASRSCFEPTVRCDTHFHYWRTQRVRYDPVSGEDTMFGIQNARPHCIDLDISRVATHKKTTHRIPKASEIIAAMADPANDTGLQALDGGRGGSTGEYVLSQTPLNGVCHPDAWFIELFDRELVSPVAHRIGLADDVPCPVGDLHLDIGEQAQLLIHNVMHLALEVPDDDFNRARWLKPSRSFADTGPMADPWSEIMAFDMHWLTNDPRISHASMNPLTQESSTGRPYTITYTTFLHALNTLPDLFSVCMHVVQTYLTRSCDKRWSALALAAHTNAGGTEQSFESAFALRTHDTDNSTKVLRHMTAVLHSEIRALCPKLRGANYVQIPMSQRLSDSLQVYRTRGLAPSARKRKRQTSMLRVDATFVLPAAVCVLCMHHTVHRPGQAPVLLLGRDACPGGERDRLMTACISILSTTVTLSNVPSCARRMAAATGLDVSSMLKLDTYPVAQPSSSMAGCGGTIPTVFRTPDFVRRAICSVVINAKHSKDGDSHMVSYKRVPGVHDFAFSAHGSPGSVPNAKPYNATDVTNWTSGFVWRAINVDLCERDRVMAIKGGLHTDTLAPMYSNGTDSDLWCGVFSVGVYLAGMCGELRKSVPNMDTSLCTVQEATNILRVYNSLPGISCTPSTPASTVQQATRHVRASRLLSSRVSRMDLLTVLISTTRKLYDETGYSTDPLAIGFSGRSAWDDDERVLEAIVAPCFGGPIVSVDMSGIASEMSMRGGLVWR